jgi:SPP1 gp7 family putative phage head morphogenesis protein
VSTQDQLDALLAPHKVALLAIESQSQQLMQEAVAVGTTTLDMTRITKRYLKAIQITVGKLSYRHASQELALYDIDAPDKPVLTDDYIKKLLGDLKSTFDDPNLSPEEKARRAGLAAVSAANRYYTEMQQAMYDSAAEAGYQVEKVWRTQEDEKVCPYCGALDGKTVAIDALFDPPLDLKPYATFVGPPAHINCRCRLIPQITKAA